MSSFNQRDSSIQKNVPARMADPEESDVIARPGDGLYFRGTPFLGPLPGFEYAEHRFLGDTIHLKNSSDKDIEAASWKFTLSNGLKLTYGEICALAGDFYGTDKPISDGKTLEDQATRFLLAFNQLAYEKDHTPSEAPKILEILQAEVGKVNEAIADHKDPWDVYPTLPDVNISLELATSGRPAPALSYAGLAEVNFDHFGLDARIAYTAGHRSALDIALKGGNDNLEMAYAMNAFADHFLQDSFAAGHLRTPRRALHREINLFADLCAKYMHDEDNAIGLTVDTPRGKHFKVFGDKRLLSPDNADNLTECKLALEASAAEIYKAWHDKSSPQEFGALKYAPTLESALKVEAQQLKPLFVDGKDVPRRSNISNRRDSTLTTNYTFLTTAADCWNSGRWKYPQPKMDPN